MLRRIVLVGVVVGLWGHLALAEIQESGVASTATTSERSESVWGNAGYGVLAMVTNLVYMPAKFVYAGLGIITGGLAYVLTVGDVDTAESVWDPSVGGTYVITPAMLRNEEPILFSGTSHERN